MKKILLSAALLAGVVANAQNPTTLMEEMDGEYGRVALVAPDSG